MKIKCARKIHFCSGHRVMGHENKCARLHGHNYNLWVYAEASSLDGIGRVIDFSVLKEKIGGWIEKNWDHKTILNGKDESLIFELMTLGMGGDLYIADFNPTAEEMASYLLMNICPALLRDTGVGVTKITLYETENCFAEVSL